MPKLITRHGSLPAEHPRDGAPIRSGRVYVAPPDHHLLVGPDIIRLSHGPKENRHRPAIDPMFRSAANVYGNRVAGVLLTGNLDDGVAGLQQIHEHHGLTIVQDPEEAPYPEMPRHALQALRPDHCLRLEEIEHLLHTLPDSAFGGRKMKGKKRSRLSKTQSPATIGAEPSSGPPIPVVCPECHGPLWEFRNGKLMRYQCLVGHRYTLANLLAAQSEELEAALWISLRTLEERINLQLRLAKEAQDTGRFRSSKVFEAHLAENKKHARVLREMLQKIGQ